MLYSKSTGGFYDEIIHGENIPTDAVEILAEDYAALMAGQIEGKRIVSDKNGNPILAEQPKKTAEQLALEVDAARAAAYRAEADPLFFKSQRGECTVEEWQAKIAEIRARYPKPEVA